MNLFEKFIRKKEGRTGDDDIVRRASKLAKRLFRKNVREDERRICRGKLIASLQENIAMPSNINVVVDEGEAYATASGRGYATRIAVKLPAQRGNGNIQRNLVVAYLTDDKGREEDKAVWALRLEDDDKDKVYVGRGLNKLAEAVMRDVGEVIIDGRRVAVITPLKFMDELNRVYNITPKWVINTENKQVYAQIDTRDKDIRTILNKYEVGIFDKDVEGEIIGADEDINEVYDILQEHASEAELAQEETETSEAGIGMPEELSEKGAEYEEKYEFKKTGYDTRFLNDVTTMMWNAFVALWYWMRGIEDKLVGYRIEDKEIALAVADFIRLPYLITFAVPVTKESNGKKVFYIVVEFTGGDEVPSVYNYMTDEEGQQFEASAEGIMGAFAYLENKKGEGLTNQRALQELMENYSDVGDMGRGEAEEGREEVITNEQNEQAGGIKVGSEEELMRTSTKKIAAGEDLENKIRQMVELYKEKEEIEKLIEKTINDIKKERDYDSKVEELNMIAREIAEAIKRNGDKLELLEGKVRAYLVPATRKNIHYAKITQAFVRTYAAAREAFEALQRIYGELTIAYRVIIAHEEESEKIEEKINAEIMKQREWTSTTRLPSRFRELVEQAKEIKGKIREKPEITLDISEEAKRTLEAMIRKAQGIDEQFERIWREIMLFIGDEMETILWFLNKIDGDLEAIIEAVEELETAGAGIAEPIGTPMLATAQQLHREAIKQLWDYGYIDTKEAKRLQESIHNETLKIIASIDEDKIGELPAVRAYRDAMRVFAKQREDKINNLVQSDVEERILTAMADCDIVNDGEYLTDLVTTISLITGCDISDVYRVAIAENNKLSEKVKREVVANLRLEGVIANIEG